MSKESSTLLWGGRFDGAMDPLMVIFNESLPFDKTLYKADITGSIAYAKSLALRGLLTEDELNKIVEGLKAVLAEWESGTFVIKQAVDEDIHTANERRLCELIGSDVGGKLHTGRSRNEQIATDLRLWLRDQLEEADTTIATFLKVAAESAKKNIDHLMPGYTHLQRAQPIRFSHWLLSHATYLQFDHQRLKQLAERSNCCTLGVGALAGNPFQVDRNFLAQELGFTSIHPNSVAAVADRDFVAETLNWATMVMVHLSRLAEDLIIYSSAEFGFVKLADAYSTGSSLMPQKKNPDSLELVRGKAGRVLGNATGFLSTLKSLSSAYNKDLQESVEPLFDTVKNVLLSLKICTGVIATLRIFPEKMRAALTVDMLATDVAEYLVRKGVPFRQTHHIAGALVKMAEDQNTSIDKLSLEQIKTISPSFEEDIAAVFDFENSVERRSSEGGTGRSSVERQIQLLEQALGSA